MISYSKGDSVVLICDGRTVDAKVLMGNQAGVLVGFDAIVGGYVGSMPLRVRDATLGLYCSVDGTEVVIRGKLSS
ncbi:hypothetical protein I6F35_06220 [Bradyrhizobium sp. BRP22]|uniref:hypothetical protein n=1 Tax=Bradyrhizobium sp. BRP22 TaxID=2793821 RepID=UPI001CD6251E|nr:hypothetical protein [Bradyrhizobium sp. BRP22]MCA1452815.1 hypothetical protein [Bradyrhizobium sp. BRP22]